MSLGHVYVVASGYSKRVVPTGVPFEFEVSDDDTLFATPAWRHAPAGRRVPHDALPDPTGWADRVVDVLDGPTRREWWLETTVYAVPLPRGWTAIVSGEVSPAFDLVRGNGAIFVQTARNRPTLDALAGPGQREIARGSDDRADWVELSYVHDGTLWVQRHALLRQPPTAMITGQSPSDEFPEIRAIQEEVSRRAEFS
jgi:hypothetical protein